MSTNNQQSSDTGQTAILIAIAIVTIAGVVGAVFSNQEAAQIIGFCTLIDRVMGGGGRRNGGKGLRATVRGRRV